jgi:hypothetical protein
VQEYNLFSFQFFSPLSLKKKKKKENKKRREKEVI